MSPLDLIEIVLDSLSRWAVSCLVFAVLLIPGAEPAVIDSLQREALAEIRSEFRRVMPRSTHRHDAKRQRSVPMKSR